MKNVVKEKSFLFAIDIVKYCKKLNQVNKEFIISKQLSRSGTAVGALICEAEMAESRKDFIHKMSVALKEANETKYWLQISRSIYPNEKISLCLLDRCLELLSLLVTIVKTAKKNIQG